MWLMVGNSFLPILLPKWDLLGVTDSSRIKNFTDFLVGLRTKTLSLADHAKQIIFHCFNNISIIISFCCELGSVPRDFTAQEKH